MENFEIDLEKGIVIMSLNPKLYSLDVVFSAAYIFTEKCYVLLDGDPLQEIMVELKPKSQDMDLKAIGREFNNELINYANYDLQFKRNARLREIFLQRIMLTNLPASDNINITQAQPPPEKTDYLEKETKPWKKNIENEKNAENNNRKREKSTETFV